MVPVCSWSFPETPTAGNGLSSSLPCNVRVVISTTELAGTKRSGLGIHGCRQRPAKAACVQAHIHLFATPVCPIPEYATGTNTARYSSQVNRRLGGPSPGIRLSPDTCPAILNLGVSLANV